jgi:hypothetical protein
MVNNLRREKERDQFRVIQELGSEEIICPMSLTSMVLNCFDQRLSEGIPPLIGSASFLEDGHSTVGCNFLWFMDLPLFKFTLVSGRKMGDESVIMRVVVENLSLPFLKY